jgi:chemotaxis protein CheX
MESVVLVNHSECLVQAASQLFSATCGATIEPVDETENCMSGDGIIGVISLVGDIEWVIFLGMPSETAVTMSWTFAGFEIPFDSDDMCDAIGEMTNMLAGLVKLNLDQKSIEADISLPTVVRSEDMTALVQQQNSVEIISFKSELGNFWTGIVAANQAV